MFFVQVSYLVIDNQMTTIAGRSDKGVDLYARAGNRSWGSEGGTFREPAAVAHE